MYIQLKVTFMMVVAMVHIFSLLVLSLNTNVNKLNLYSHSNGSLLIYYDSQHT